MPVSSCRNLNNLPVSRIHSHMIDPAKGTAVKIRSPVHLFSQASRFSAGSLSY